MLNFNLKIGKSLKLHSLTRKAQQCFVQSAQYFIIAPIFVAAIANLSIYCVLHYLCLCNIKDLKMFVVFT